ncbi:MAG: cyclodeaminase/cyclohydrolase family protein [Clostridia bacterium]|nr:cyclodeaminase/cyclohydrolase family protein [Clostridia bacterium]
MDNISQWSCEKFVNETSSKAPVPGGGGVAALVGSVGTALAGMVCSLTTNKNEYKEYEEDFKRILSDSKVLQENLLSLINRDAENFLPLAQCYKMKADTAEEIAKKEEAMQTCLKTAISAPAEIIKITYKAIKLQEELRTKAPALTISDVGCGAVCLKAALQSGWLNILINLKLIKDEEYIKSIKGELLPLVEEGSNLADKIYENINSQLNS